MKSKIKSIMIINGYKGTCRELAEILQISEPSAVNKLNGREAFKVREIRLFADKFKLNDEDICDIFIRRSQNEKEKSIKLVESKKG